MSDTPRTDAELRTCWEEPRVELVLADFARTLERENVKLRAALEIIAKAPRNGFYSQKIAEEALKP